jgi:hypothetical protein
LAFNPDSEGWFKSREWTCQACAELDRYAADQKDKQPAPGTVVGLVNEMPPGHKLRPLPLQ